MRRIICELIIVTLVRGEDVLAGSQGVRCFDAARSNPDAALIIHPVKQAGAAEVAESAARKI